MNPYDPCVANQLVSKLQQYIIFHIADCKSRQMYTKVNDSFIGVLRE